VEEERSVDKVSAGRKRHGSKNLLYNSAEGIYDKTVVGYDMRAISMASDHRQEVTMYEKLDPVRDSADFNVSEAEVKPFLLPQPG
jgi:hypothetical protein